MERVVFLAIVHDISTRQAREQEKEHLQTQLLHAQKLESVGQLAAGIAHEINTPTQFVGTNIDFLEDFGVNWALIENINHYEAFVYARDLSDIAKISFFVTFIIVFLYQSS